MQPMWGLVYSIGYQLNKEFIADTYCKNKPQLNCLGKCHLIESIEKAEEGEKNSKAQPKHVEQFQIIEQPFVWMLAIRSFHLIIYSAQVWGASPLVADIFRPPRSTE